jgi:hypothetical protein
MPTYRVLRIDPGGRGVMFDGRNISIHMFRTKADPVKAAEEQVYIEWLRQKEAREAAEQARQAKKRGRKK